MRFGKIKIAGRQFHRLTAIVSTDGNFLNTTKWKCECVCGNICFIRANSLLTGNTKSCGCLAKESSLANGLKVKHGLTKSAEYRAWSSMKNRCYNKKVRSWKNYGARGITVCAEWLDSFENFLSDMGFRPGNGFSLERLEVNGNYEPSNCKWATKLDQANNKRNNLFFKLNGETLTLAQISKKYKIPAPTLISRLRRDKLSIEEAVAKKASRYLITYRGETKTIGEWARLYGIGYTTLKTRLAAGVPFEYATLKTRYTNIGYKSVVCQMSRDLLNESFTK